VQLLEETGILGAGLFVLMLAPPLFSAFGAALLGRSGSHWAAAAFAAFALALLHGVVDFGLQVPAIAAFLSFCLGAFSLRVGGGARAYVSDAPTTADAAASGDSPFVKLRDAGEATPPAGDGGDPPEKLD
jgi:hypothetical protein